MNAQEVLDRVLAEGGEIVRDGAAPRLRVPPALKPLVEEHRHEIRALVMAQPPAMPSLTAEALATFAREGDAVGFRVPWCPAVLWWAPTPTEAARLVAWGIAERGAIWTADELAALIGLAGPDARAVVSAKLAVGGAVVETRRRDAA